jgi:hypothetical protein
MTINHRAIASVIYIVRCWLVSRALDYFCDIWSRTFQHQKVLIYVLNLMLQDDLNDKSQYLRINFRILHYFGQEFI